jgi:hypothetical protein
MEYQQQRQRSAGIARRGEVEQVGALSASRLNAAAGLDERVRLRGERSSGTEGESGDGQGMAEPDQKHTCI